MLRWDVEGGPGTAGGSALTVDSHCLYDALDARDGRRLPGNIGWGGKQTARKQGDRVGRLLDLDQGSITVGVGRMTRS